MSTTYSTTVGDQLLTNICFDFGAEVKASGIETTRAHAACVLDKTLLLSTPPMLQVL